MSRKGTMARKGYREEMTLALKSYYKEKELPGALKRLDEAVDLARKRLGLRRIRREGDEKTCGDPSPATLGAFITSQTRTVPIPENAPRHTSA